MSDNLITQCFLGRTEFLFVLSPEIPFEDAIEACAQRDAVLARIDNLQLDEFVKDTLENIDGSPEIALFIGMLTLFNVDNWNICCPCRVASTSRL